MDACLTGDAGPRDLVAETGFGWFRTISLYCGDITKGIVHIVQSHAIDEGGADDDDVVPCMDAILENGDEKEATSSLNESYEAKRSDFPQSTYERLERAVTSRVGYEPALTYEITGEDPRPWPKRERATGRAESPD